MLKANVVIRDEYRQRVLRSLASHYKVIALIPSSLGRISEILIASAMAAALRISRQTVNELLRERRSITPVMALRLSRLFGNSPEFWLNAQHARDLWESEHHYSKELSRILPLHAA